MFEPAAHQGSEGSLVGRQLLQDLRLRAAVRHDVQEVIDRGDETDTTQRAVLLEKLIGLTSIGHLEVLVIVALTLDFVELIVQLVLEPAFLERLVTIVVRSSLLFA